MHQIVPCVALFICIKRKIVKLNKGFLYPLCIWLVKCLFLFDFFV